MDSFASRHRVADFLLSDLSTADQIVCFLFRKILSHRKEGRPGAST